MKDEILSNLNHPKQLEKLYRENRGSFQKAFNALYPDLKDNKIADVWYERINYETSAISLGTRKDLIFVILLALVAGFLAKVPHIFNIDEELYYSRNISFIVFPGLVIYFAWKNKLLSNRLLAISTAILISAVFINFLPANNRSDTLLLTCIHMPIVLWSLLGYAFSGNQRYTHENRLAFLRYNGDLVVMTTLLFIAGMLMSGITIALFSLIGFQIEKFYFENIGIIGLAALPVVANFIVQVNPQVVNRVSPIIANIFSPLVLIMLAIYLIAMLYGKKDPYNDRDFLMMFNLLLIAVMALILFSVAESSKSATRDVGVLILFLLSAVTIIVNGIALSAIGFRLVTQGVTPNRLAVLGGNVLMLANLVLVAIYLLGTLRKKSDIEDVAKAIASFLPVYSLWAIVVAFLFPLIFNFR